jgi:hypothetical protein
MNSRDQQQLIQLAATPFDGRYEYYSFEQLRSVYNQLGSVQAIEQLAESARRRRISFMTALQDHTTGGRR